MKKLATVCVGLDVHKDSTPVAHAPAYQHAEVTYVGRFGTRLADIERLIRRLEEKVDRMAVAYEAWP